MKKNLLAKFFLLILTVLFLIPKTFALNYTINFTGKGASTTVDRVVVQNLTRGTTVTVPAGGDLNLTDNISGIEQITTDDEDIQVYTNHSDGKINISFFARHTGSTQINVYSMDGKRIAMTNSNLPIGENSYQLILPKGLYAVQVVGNGYTYSVKIISQASIFMKPGIAYTGTQNKLSSGIQKIKNSGVTTMFYSTGNLLIYKGFSGNNSTIVTDRPATSKTLKFDFVECKDAIGNYYSVVKIGSQTWMAENLKTNKFRNGEDIINLTNNTDWGMFPISSWCNYNHDATKGTSFGKLYNWYAVSDSRNIAPIGWHVASDADWTALTTFLGGESVSGGKLKQTDLTLWDTPNTLATNEAGFSAFPGGYRLTTGQFDNIGSNGNWWSLTENGLNYAWYRYMYKGSASVVRDYYNKNVGFSVRCIKDAELPILSTVTPTSITYTTAVGGGNITSDGGAPVTVRGVCWSTTANPTISNSKSIAGTGIGTFTSSITGLNINSTYYVRAYATNSSGTAYGEQLIFNSKPYDALTATDADGNLYHTITIGNQVWMVENLKTTKYRNGDVIGTTSSINMNLSYATNPKYQWAYNGLESNVPIYGRLYTWHAVADARNIAPVGWHVASDAEWTILQNYLITNGYNYDKTTVGNKIAKSLCSTNLWDASSIVGSPGNNSTQNNASGLSMVPTGYRGFDGMYYVLGNSCYYWNADEYSTTNAVARALGIYNSDLVKINSNKNYGFSVWCIKNTLPLITTSEPSSILSTTVNCGGNVTADGGEAVTEYGVCWSTSETPTISDDKKSIGSGTGAFTTSITGLDVNTTYYVRAYATNSLGTSYGLQVSFKTLLTDPPTVTDIDGNVYNTVTIGTQTWMVENLKVTKYNDGVAIPYVNNGYNWGYMITPAYCWYNNDIANKSKYGAMYNWYAVNTKKLCPQGWHVPSNDELTELTNYLGGLSASTLKLKEAGNLHWFTSNNVAATNESNFTALPGGYRRYSDGVYFDMGSNASFWSSSSNNEQEAWSRAITLSSTDVHVISNIKSYGISVRCIKNTLPSITTNVPTSILSTTVNCGGNVTGDGGEAVTEYGVCWSTSVTPTIADTKKSIGSGTGTFTTSITGLDVNTTYYVRAYATNRLGTSYGLQVSFKTLLTNPPTVTDIDGNLYHSVVIGTQTWMVENLKTTKYRNGDVIGTTSSINMDLTYATTPKYQWAYNGLESNVPLYGRLYTWHAVADVRNLAPVGWHVASDAEWTILQNYLITNGYNYDKTTVGNKIAKSLCSTNLWNTSYNVGSPGYSLAQNNSSGFSMIPAGYRGYDGYFYLLGNGCDLWTSTENSVDQAKYRAIGNSTIHFESSSLKKNYGFSVRCIKNTLPTITTNAPTSILSTTVNCGGNVTGDGGEAVTEYGVCWSTSETPTIADSKKSIGSGTGTFTTSITGLDVNTTYYVRAYATNSLGTSYGLQVSFKTLLTDPPTVTDIDGNLYHSVVIGTQTWMVENLKTTKYRNGDVIGTTSSINMDLTNAVSPKYQWAYNGLESHVPLYGRLYTWHVVADARNIAPVGWHVASDAEWNILQNYLITNGYNYDKTTVGNKIAKSLCSTILWNTNSNVGTPSSDLTQNNASGFSSVPTGYRGFDGMYYLLGNACYFWTVNEYSTNTAAVRYMGINNSDLMMTNNNKNYGFSARCIKNTLPSISTSAPSSILSTSVNCGGNVIGDGGETVTEYGVCWGTSVAPTIADTKKSIGSGTGTFTTSITGLAIYTTYYVRAYATNSLGTAYGNELSFKTQQ